MTFFIKLPLGARKISKITLSIINFRCYKPSEQGKKKNKFDFGTETRTFAPSAHSFSLPL